MCRIIHRHARWFIKPRRRSQAIRAARTRRKTRDGRHYPAGRNFPDRVVAVVGDENIAGGVHRHAPWIR